ncbi:MAG: serine/threonine protein kinase [Planctomycetota bacterium]|nr:MAG: serine/threonine protein kinase [Planctomycetota bacterium]
MNPSAPELGAAALERLAQVARDAASPTDALARYELGRELGRGAMGVVVEARDLHLDRTVALKLLSRTAELSADARARFLREARAAARLSHPAIAAVYDANEAFIAMQLVDGLDLATRPVRDPRLLATLLRDAALAVHYAHSQGIVHRDLKPANLMVTGDDPPRIMVTDFGLAKATELGPTLSRSGTIIGTPAYMAPEQALGDGAAVDARADVYGLGATLFEQLAGRPPFQSESVLEVLRQVVEEEPPPLRSLVPAIDRDLATITHKCLAKAPEQRYASALAFAGDLDRWLSGEMILARPPSLLYRARRFLARRQGQLAAAGAAAVLALLLFAPFWLQARERRASAESALVLAENVNRALDDARALRAGSRPAEAAAILDEAVAATLAFTESADVGRAQLFLGRLYRAQGRMQEAEHAFDRALELDETLSEARFERGMARAVLVREGTQPLQPFPPPMEELRAAALADLAATPAAEGPVASADRRLGQGQLAWLRGELKLAERLCQDAIELEPAQVEARLVLARIASENHDDARAMFLAAEAVDVMGGMGQVYRGRLQVGSAAIEPTWIRLPGRREIVLDLRKAASATPTSALASGALALEGLEAGARALAANDPTTALRELETADSHLTRALNYADADPVLLAARGVCSQLRDEALINLQRAPEAAQARSAALQDLTTAAQLGSPEVRAVSWWNQSLFHDRQTRLALLSGNAAAAATARQQAADLLSRALAAAPAGSDLAAWLRE